MFFRSQRLFLRPIWPEDAGAIHAAVSEAVARNLAQVPWPYRPEDAAWFAGQPHNPWFPELLVTRPDAPGGPQLLGCIGLIAPRDAGADAELGYWLAEAHWGRGYATEAGRGVLAMAQALGYRRIAAHHFADNPASGRVLARLGFRRVGDAMLTSRARGGEVAAARFTLDLAAPQNGDDSGGDMRRAA
ncbi:MAG: GNAT family N-acetyltransferase [Proteobacteria bacterium]|nr:GNAT family N-acetyltransferase [Pseudomonadota bacterium]